MSKNFTFEELKTLNTKENVHLLIHGKVYAISKFMDEHPGGDEVLLGETGRDATEAFEDVGHSDEAREIMEKYLVGECAEGAPKGPKTPAAAVNRANETNPSSYAYLLPLAFLAAYLAWRYTQ